MLDEQAGFSKLGGMNPSKLAVSLLFLTISLLLLGSCEEMLQSGGNPPAYVPAPQPGAGDHAALVSVGDTGLAAVAPAGGIGGVRRGVAPDASGAGGAVRGET